MSIPRPEYPRPQFVRDQWLCLNGEWQFEIDCGDSGIDRGLKDKELPGKIIVPFCPESELSGIGNVDFMNAVWYRREVPIPAEWSGKRVLLNFQAVDYDATIWVNGTEVARHRGGSTPIICDLAGVAAPGDTATIVVRARDVTGVPQSRGKQAGGYNNVACVYTRTTGIWQTVWMEPVADTYLLRPRITPDVGASRFYVEMPIRGQKAGMSVRLSLSDDKGCITQCTRPADTDFSPAVELQIPEDRRRLWSIDDPFLYDLLIELVDASGKTIDQFKSYAGLRSVTIDGMAIKINGRTVFQRLVLDQGYYADGIMTAPTDEALIKDIELSIAAGFNGARLHQKVFEERFLYHCDRMGYIVWAEFPDWGCHGYGPGHDHWKPGANYITQWVEEVERDYSHPSIVGWCPLNETWQDITDRIYTHDEIHQGMWRATKLADRTRPVLDVSGYAHRVLETDVYDSHDYEQDPAKFKERHDKLLEGKPFINGDRRCSTPYKGQPYFCSEFGGIRWNPTQAESSESWGYGDAPKSLEEFYTRFEGLCAALLDNPKMFGYCYTQLTDVFQEQNGIYYFDRSTKFDMERIKAAQVRKAAIEE